MGWRGGRGGTPLPQPFRRLIILLRNCQIISFIYHELANLLSFRINYFLFALNYFLPRNICNIFTIYKKSCQKLLNTTTFKLNPYTIVHELGERGRNIFGQAPLLGFCTQFLLKKNTIMFTKCSKYFSTFESRSRAFQKCVTCHISHTFQPNNSISHQILINQFQSSINQAVLQQYQKTN